MVDFSDPRTKALYKREVQKRVDEFGMSNEQAQMLVAVLMTPKFREEDCPGHVASGSDSKICGNCGVHIDSLRPPEEPDA